MFKDQLFEFNDTIIEKVEVPEWGELGENVYVRNMSGRGRDVFEMGIYNAKGTDAQLYNMRAKLTVLCCCDKEGKLHFDDSDGERLGDKSAAALSRIFNVAKRLNKIGAGDVAEMEKQLEDNQS